MLAYVGALVAAALASAVWCAADADPHGSDAPRGARILTAALLLAAVGVAAALRVALVPGHHAMYLDEPWYAEAACNLVRRGQLALCEESWAGTECAPYGKAWGWPLLLSPLVAWSGCATTVGIALDRLLGVATVALVAVASRCAGGRWWQGALAAAVLAIHPLHVAWSATGETNVAAAATELLGLCGALRFARRGRASGAALAASGLALATAIRPESLAPAVVCAAVLAAVAATTPRRRRLAGVTIAAAAALAAAGGMDLWRMNADISGGGFLSPVNLVANAAGLLAPPALLVHGAVALLVLGGAVAAVRSPQRRAAWVLIAPAVAGAAIALAYDRFHERMLLSATVAALPLVGSLFDAPMIARGPRLLRVAAPCLVLLALTGLWSQQLTRLSLPPETQLLETRLATRVAATATDPNALLIAEHPTVLRAAGVERVMASARALEGEASLLRLIGEGRPVHFLCDMYCEPDFQGAGAPTSCATILRRFAMTPVTEETLPGRRYVLYRLTGPATGREPAPECPRPVAPAQPPPEGARPG